jgi:DNA-directed RNA polymerase specialized sigma24 family protein
MDIFVFQEEKMSQKYNENFIKHLSQIKYVANKVADKFGGYIVVDELVNEAWLRGINSDRRSKYQFIQRAAWDMKDYVRSLFGRTEYSYKGKIVPTKKRPSFITNCEPVTDDDNNEITHGRGHSIFDGKIFDKNLFNLENKELIVILMDRTTTQSAEALVDYYLNEHELIETGKYMHRSPPTISQYLKKGRADCLLAVKEMDLENVAI